MNFPRTVPIQAERAVGWRSAASAAVWFAVLAGIVEGAGLLLFQRINWERWGPMIHVTREILWISPLVDLIFFLAVGLVFALALRTFRRLPAGTLVFVFAFLTVYDWLTLTARLRHGACLLLALGVAAVFVRWLGKREDQVWRFWRRTAPWALFVWLLFFAGIEGGKWLAERRAVAQLPPAAPGAPNVLVIVVDTLRADHVSSYGYQRPTTPNLDRIAGQGAAFQNAVATCSWSLPSHVALLTGRYEYEHGVGNVQPEPWLGWGKASFHGYLTLGEALEQHGYRTGAFSANHTYFAHHLGFERSFMHFEDYFQSASDMFVRTLYGREFARLYLNRTDKSKVKRGLRFLGMDSLLDKDSEGSSISGGAQAVRKRAGEVNHETLRWIDRDRERPFFVFLNYFDVHSPYGSPWNYPKPAWDTRNTIGAYDAAVKYVDDQIGELMSELEHRGLEKNTLVIITSDHGESLGDHGLTYHASALYWELVHVPMIFWYPGHVPAGQRVLRPVSNAAIPAAVMDLLGYPQVFSSSASSEPWRTGGDETNWPFPLSELAANNIMSDEDKAASTRVPTAFTGSMKSLVAPQRHLITHSKMGDQVFDWVNDPSELRDLMTTPEGKGSALELKSQLPQKAR